MLNAGTLLRIKCTCITCRYTRVHLPGGNNILATPACNTVRGMYLSYGMCNTQERYTLEKESSIRVYGIRANMSNTDVLRPVNM